MRIPPGSVSSYEQIANQIGPKECSAGSWERGGAQPYRVLIPCHRVIRKLGEFGNYRYGTARKKALLVREFAAIEIER